MVKPRGLICNTYNYFEYDKLDESVKFWGLDIKPKKLKTTVYIIKLLEICHVCPNEIIEIYDDETCLFFSKVYYLND